MNIQDYLKIKAKKILVADAKSVGNAVRRIANIQNGVDATDVTTMTVGDIAKELVLAYEAFHGTRQDITILDRDSAAYVLDNIILDNKPGFIPEESLTIATVRQIYNALCIIRSFDKSEEYLSSADQKIIDLKRLISAYECKLEGEGLYDDPALINKAIDILKMVKNGELEYPLGMYLTWFDECVFGDLSTNKRKGLADTFMTLLLEIKGCSAHCIEFLAYDDIEQSKQAEAVNWDFFVSYGQTNEIQQVCKEILEMTSKKNVCFDSICVCYTAPEYENFLTGAFEVANIPYILGNSYHATNTDFVQLLLAILDFADSGYEYSRISKIVNNDCLTFSNICKDTSMINPHNAFRNTRGKDIGWGRERYEDYLEVDEVKEAIEEARNFVIHLEDKFEDELSEIDEDEKNSLQEDEAVLNAEKEKDVIQKEERELTEEEKERFRKINKGFFAILLQELLEIFDENNEVAQMYEQLIKFARRYTYRRNAGRREVIRSIGEQIHVFERLSGERAKTVSAKIGYIRDYLEKLTVSHKTGSVSAVSIQKIGSFKVLEGEYNYFIGLGAKQFAEKAIESAVMSDAEMERYLVGANIPFAKDINTNKQENFKATLRSLKKGKICISYSKFDTVELREMSPSVMFMELQADAVIDKKVSYNPKTNSLKINGATYVDWVKNSFEEQLNTYKDKKVVKVTDVAKMSASVLQKLLECPMYYYYKSIRMLSVPEFRTKNGHEWLPPIDRGNLFHRVAEKYMEQIMPPVKPICEEMDEKLFDTIYQEQIAIMEHEVPWTNDFIKQRECEEYKEDIKVFLGDLHKKWYEDKEAGKEWWLLGCELDFDEEDNLIYIDNGEHLKTDVNDEENVNADGVEDAESSDETAAVVKDPLDGLSYKIHFTQGQIDRLDGFVDENGILNLRIIDYKTGKKDKKLSEINDGIQIQHLVYAMAAFDYIKKLKDKVITPKNGNIFDKYDIKGVKLEEVAYVFPLEGDNNKELSVMNIMNELVTPLNHTNDEENTSVETFDWKVEFPYSVRRKLRLTEGYRQCGKVDIIAQNVKDLIPDDKKCRYCDYKEVCRMNCGVDKTKQDEYGEDSDSED